MSWRDIIDRLRTGEGGSTTAPRSLELSDLEERVLYSATPVPVPAEADGATAVDVQTVDSTADAARALEPPTSPISSEDLLDLVADSIVVSDVQQVAAEDVRELVFVDSSVPDVDQLLADLRTERGDDRGLEVITLDSTRNGIAQITAALTNYSDIDAIHIVSHGTDGQVALGSEWLSADNFDQYREVIAGWSNSMSDQADILFYGCDLAASDSGRELLQSIAEVTGSDVAGSDDLTGHAALAADWNLEYVVGVVETDLAFSVDVQQNWFGTLESVTVTTLDDVVDRNASSVADLINNPGADGVISLREAIIASNVDNDADVIHLGAGVHTLSLAGSGDQGGDLDINRDVQIIGLANGASVIDGSGLTDERVFDVANNDATFQYLTITGGNATGDGGGIRVGAGSEAVVDNVIVNGNSAAGSGGGIRNFGTLIVTNSTISSNTADTFGGGISSSSGTIHVENATVSGNMAEGDAGGIFVNNNSHDFINVTISGNTSGGDGGGIVVRQSTTANFEHVTITNNTAVDGGGGVFNTFSQGTVNATGAIIAGNHASTNQDMSGGLDINVNNIIGGDTDMLLGELADNGGPVQTHALLPETAAINQAGPATEGEPDGRGFLVDDGNRDIGAFEFNATPASQLAGLLFSTASDVTGSAVPGLNDWDNQDVIQIGDPNLTIENGDGFAGTSDGTFSELIDFQAFADPTTNPSASIDGLHRVGTHLTFFGIDLQPGDVLFSTTQATSYTSNNSAILNPGNVHLFRPDTPGDYSVGTFTEDVVNHVALGIGSITTFTLVETDTIVGGQALSAGDFLFTSGVVNISRYDTSASQLSLLVHGSGLGITSAITGLELIERAHTSGDITLDAGTLLLHTIADAPSLGSNGIASENVDVVAFNLSSTGVGNTAGTASIVFDGSDVGLTSAERFNSLSLETVPDVQTGDATGITDLSSGVEINTDGNNAFLLADDGATVLGGRDAVTVETIFASTSNDGLPTLFSYAAGSTSGNDFRIQFNPLSNELNFYVNGTAVFVPQANFDFNSLFDGQPHSLAVSWSSTAGEWTLYVDGDFVISRTGLETGNTIAAGGTLLFGQEQDSIGGGFQQNEVFNGTLFDVRVWDRVRTESEIAESYQQKLDPTAIHEGLIANWQFDQFDGSTVTDVVNGNNLSVEHVPFAGFAPSTPVNDLTVVENASDGTSVGFLITTGGNPDTTSFTLLDNADGRFAIDETTGEITVADSSLLNFDNNASHDIIVEVTDGSVTYSETITIDVSDINEPSVFSNLDDTVTYVVGGDPVVLDADATIFDTELDAIGHFDGARLQVSEFLEHTLGINGVQVMAGQDIVVSDVTIGTVSGNSFGFRPFDFNSNATNELVNQFIQSITYEYIGTDPAPAEFTHQWRFTDGLDLSFAATGQTTVQLVEPTIDLSTGISLNNDGGTDAYLISDAGLGTPLTATTFEILFAATDRPHETVFVSFNSGTGSGDELAIQTDDSGALELDFGSGGLVFADQIDYADALLDGERHSLAVTWDSASGDWEVYIDGQLEESGSNLNQNEQLDTTNGRFVFGQDQDGLDTGYQNDQRLDGTIYDVRIWDGVRSATEIAENYQQKLDPNDLPNGLVANWQFDGFDSSGQVVEVVDGNNLSVRHAPETSRSGEYFTSNPVDALNVDENSSDGTSVGFVIVTSNGDTSSNTFTLSNDAGGRFAINRATGEITVANENLLNHEANQSHVVTVAVRDGLGNDYGETFTITVNNVNEAPTFDAPLTPTLTLESSTPIAGASTVVTADIDDDGHLDLVSTAGKTITWHENNGAGGFFERTVTTHGSLTATSVTVADVDGDGHLDLVAAFSTSLLSNSEIVWYRNDGSQNFAPQTIASNENAGANSVTTADVDGDGDIDVLVAAGEDDSIVWYENDDSQSFTPHEIAGNSVGIADGASSVTTADLDGDGDLDVLSASRGDNTIAWYENDGNQNFTRRVIDGFFMGARSVTAADVDGDGTIDVLGAAFDSNEIAWFKNNGDGTFAQEIVNATNSNPAGGANSVTTADIDGDGDLDILSTSFHDNEVVWYENDGSPVFTAHIITSNAMGASSVATGDLNGDGYLDVISASETDGIIATYESNGNRFNTLAGSVFTLENSTNFIDTNVQIFDPELSGLNNNIGNFEGATLTIERSGGANSEDEFSAGGDLTFNTNGEFALLNVPLGTFTNSAGQIELTFGPNVTNAQVNEVMQSLRYRNSSDAPPSSLDLVWTFNDNNDGSQGDGEALEVMETRTVMIFPINDAPTITGLDSNVAYTENAAPVILDDDVVLFDAELQAFGNYDGATLSIARTGGASPEDAFGGVGLLKPLIEGLDLDYDGETVGTVIVNSGGQLELQFNSNATEAVVNDVARAITYASLTDAPPASVNLEWTFNEQTGAGGGSLEAVANIEVNITPVNDAPVLNGLGFTPRFDNITEDDIDNSGELISDLLTEIGNPITDPDGLGVIEGIAVISNGEDAGVWQYSIDGGATWQDVGNVGQTNALLLRDSDLLRLNPDGVAGGNANLGFRAWDQTSFDAGDRINISANGGTGGSSSFSLQTLSAQIAVLDVNDAPTVDLDSLAPDIGYTTEYFAGSSPVAIVNVGNSSIADVDNTIERLTVTLANFELTEAIGDATSTLPITRVVDPDSGVITFVSDGSATNDHFQTLLDSLTYSNTDTTATGSRIVTIVANDGAADSLEATATVNITANSVPVIDLNGNSSGVDHTVMFTENFPAPPITAGSIVNDSMEGDIVTLTINAGGFGATNPEDTLIILGVAIPAGTNSSIGILRPSGVTVSLVYDGNETFTFTNQAGTTESIPTDDLQTIVRSIEFRNTSDRLVDDTINFEFTLEDSAGQRSAGATSSLSVNATNDAPVLNNAGLNTLTAIDEDNFNSDGNTIAHIIASSGLADAITDADDPDAPEGIAIFTAEQTNGTWEYSTDGGNSWTEFGSPSPTAALLLSEDAYVRFVPNPNFFGDALFSYQAWDQTSGIEGETISLAGNTGGANTLSSATDTARITVSPINDAPEFVASPPAQQIPEDTTLTFSSADGNEIVIRDVDANGAEVALSIQVNSGVVSLGSTTGITSLMGNGTDSITLTGTIADINLALEGLTYDSNENFNGPDQLSITINDQGNTGGGGSLTEVANVAINVTPVNDAPVIDLDADDSAGTAGLDFTTSFVTGNGPVSLTDGTAVDDIDSTIQTLRIQISNIQDGADEILALTSNPNIGSSYTSSTGLLTLFGGSNATNADFRAVVNSLTYENVSTTPDTTTRTITFIANDGVRDSIVATTFVSLTGDITAPSAVNNLGSSVNEGEPDFIEFSELSYSDDLQPTGDITFTVTSETSNGFLALATNPLAEITSFTQVDIDNRNLVYIHDGSETVSDSFTFTVDDGQGNSQAGQIFNITVVPQNDAPVTTVPGNDVTDEDTPLVFSSASGNPITISDSDAGNSLIEVTVSAANGTITLGSTLGINISNGTGTDDSTVTFRATQTIAEEALDGLTLTPTADHNGGATVTITTNDLGSFGAGGAMQDTDSISISVAPVNDAPVLDTSATLNLTDINEDDTDPPGDTVASILASAAGDRITDVDQGAVEGIAITGADITNGIWQFSTNNGAVWQNVVNPSSSNAIVLDLNARVRFVPNADYFGPSGDLTFRAWDQTDGLTSGTTGANIASSIGGTGAYSNELGAVSLNVLSVNDAPVGSNANYVIDENTANGTSVGVVPFTDPDVGDSHTFAILGGNTGNAFAIDASGSVTVANSSQLDFEATSSFSLDVEITDFDQQTSTVTITIDLTDVNDEAPVVDAGQTFTVSENAVNNTVVGTVTASDVDTVGSLQDWAITSGNSDGIFEINSATGEISILDNSALNFEATNTYLLEVTVQDGANTSAVVPVTINVTDENEPFALNVVSNAVDENTPNGTVVAQVVVTDPDANDTHSFAVTGGTGATAFTINAAGEIVVADVSELDFETATELTLEFSVTDSGNLTAPQTITLALNDQNDVAPTIVPQPALTIAEDSQPGTSLGVLAVTDIDTVGTLGNWAIVGGDPDGVFDLDPATGELTIADSSTLDFETTGSYSLQIQVDDGVQNSAVQTVVVNVLDVNEAPGISLNAVVTVLPENSDTTLATTVATITVPDDALGTNNLAVTGPDAGNFEIVGNELRLRAGVDLDFEVQDRLDVTVLVDDSTVGASPDATAGFTLNVTDVIEAPTISAVADQVVAEDQTTGPITFNVSNPQAGTLTVAASSSDTTLIPLDGIVVSGTGSNQTISITPAANLNGGPVIITLTADDGTSTSQRSFEVVVTPVNDLPVITNPDVSVTAIEDAAPEQIDLNQLFADIDTTTNTDSLTFTLVDDSAQSVAVATLFGGVLDLSLLPDQNGTGSVTVRATDQAGSSIDYVVPIDVAAVNDAPTAISPSITTAAIEDGPQQTLDLASLFADVDILTNSDRLEFSVVSNNDPGLVSTSLDGSSLELTFAPDGNGLATLVLEAQDQTGDTVQMVIAVDVAAVNDAPIVLPETFVVSESESLIVEPGGLLLNDRDLDSDVLTAELIAGTSNGTLTLAAGGFSYLADDGFVGTDSFTYSVTDGQATSAPITVTIEVVGEPVPDTPPPVAAPPVAAPPVAAPPIAPPPVTEPTVAAPTPNPGAPVVAPSFSPSVSQPAPSVSVPESPAESDSSETQTPSDNAETSKPTAKKDSSSPQVLAGPIAAQATEPAVAEAEAVQSPFIPEVTVEEVLASLIPTEPEEELVPETGRIGDGNGGTGGSSSRSDSKAALLSLLARKRPLTQTELVIDFSSPAAVASEQQVEKEIQLQTLAVGTTAVVSSGLSVGYVIWLLRGGTLLASMVSALPAWVAFDPLPVLDSFEDAKEEVDDEGFGELLN